ncbi:unnamed protein product [Kuraishia capsulata CBS 1993]|uniref:Bile pigment transporter 1 n=1 Tax=Kuraishia capsulata CBS 1993 TaxID=1382522 RepID=W6MGC3_9ASCO|nr:uncharacterized protein KUCA_T00000803001 [Kuraishia capsulata CBS 1993]CDK24836.1 unnamed protein product [Kuraishia capsulata CBS 1993]
MSLVESGITQSAFAVRLPESGGCQNFNPLISPKTNSLNPCFWALVVFGVAVAGGAVCIGQNISLKLTTPRIRRTSRNRYDIAKLGLVGVYALLALVLTSLVSSRGYDDHKFMVISYGASVLVVIFGVFPLHIEEARASLIPCGCLLLFWGFHIMINLGLLIQQVFGEVVPIAADNAAPVLAVLLVLSSSILFLELAYWVANERLVEAYKARKMSTNIHNLFSALTFSWMNFLINECHRKQTLDDKDIPSLPDMIDANYSSSKMKYFWNKQLQLKNKKASLLIALIQSFWRVVSIACFFDFSESVISFAQPQLLRLLIAYFGKTTNDYPLIYGFSLAFAMFVVSVAETSLHNQYFIKTVEAGLGARSALMTLVYEKSLSISPEAKMERSTGDIVNHMSVDVMRVQDMTEYLQTMVSTPTKLALALFLLFRILGPSTWGGIVVLAIMLPINSLLVKRLRSFHKQQMKFKDKRTSIVSEILMTIKSIKLYAWEKPMLEKLSDVRNNQELKNLSKIGVFAAIVNFAWTCVPFFVSCVSFSIYALTSSEPLTPEIVFPALSLFNLLSEPIFEIPALLTSMIESSVSLNRLSSFLTADDIDEELVLNLPKQTNHKGVAVEVKNCTFLWSKNSPSSEGDDEEAVVDSEASSKVALRDINFTAHKGELSCIIGRVGSGKSTFIQSILGELACVSADVYLPASISIRGSVAYCSQVAFIMNATVKENILFGAKFDQDFYDKTIAACELVADLSVLPDGDDTLVGEKGISLSGGQKARVSLARAVYARADVYLFDDILSAVDAHVGQNIVKNVLSNEGILHSKTRILATNSVTILPTADKITLIKNKSILETGTFGALMSSKSGVYELIKEFGSSEGDDEPLSVDFDANLTEGQESSSVTSVDTSSSESSNVSLGLENHKAQSHELTKVSSHQTLRRASMESAHTPIHILHQDEHKKKKTFIKSEKTNAGKVKWSVYGEYAKACGFDGVLLLLFFMIMTTTLSVMANYWLKHWSENNAEDGANSRPLWFISIYAVLCISASLTTLFKSITMWLLCSLRGARNLHDRMAKGVIGSPMEFFETTPLGRVTNRFSHDVNRVDESLARMFVSVGDSLFRIIFTLGVIGYSLPLFLVFMCCLSVIYYYYQKFYLSTSRELKRMTSNARSPIYSHLQETINGTDTIRAFGEQNRFSLLNIGNINYSNKSLYSMKSVNRWLSTRLQFLGSVIIFVASSLAIVSLTSANPMSAGMVGLVMNYALRVTNSFNFIVRRSVEVESNLVCVERMLEYINLPQEEDPQTVSEFPSPPKEWPEFGAVEFKNYSARYRKNLDPVLRNVSLSIKSCEKIGVVGRTGAGKSTLALALFRLIEPADGHVEVDHLNTGNLKLFDLRRKLSIIPQDSQAIGGTVRMNLDPLGQYTDDQLWSALEMAHLKEHVMQMTTTNKPDDTHEFPQNSVGLDAKVAEGGSNFSVGQRQLLCLARALLNPSKILLLDEATAAVDVQTDRIVQETIRSSFKDRTIITIAHRLDTVMDSDKIVVLETGEVKEFDSPSSLLKDKTSKFYKLCESGGYLDRLVGAHKLDEGV